MKASTVGIAVLSALIVVGGGGFYLANTNADDQSDVISSSQSAKTSVVASSSMKTMKPKAINWEDLLPADEQTVLPLDAASDFLKPDSNGAPSTTPFSSNEMGGSAGPMTPVPVPQAKARADMADTFVKLAGYMTPFNVEEGKTRSFLLVPYVGACIHVPAPPANQIVLVETKEPIEVKELWEPFEAVGMLRVENISTGLAEVSYTMELDRIEPFVYDEETEDQTEVN